MNRYSYLVDEYSFLKSVTKPQSISPCLTPPQVGWKYQDIVAALEAKRKVKGEAFHKGKLEVAKARAACMKDAKVAKQIAPFQKVIESYGHQ